MEKQDIDVKLEIHASKEENTIITKQGFGEKHLHCLKWCFIIGLFVGVLISYCLFNKESILNSHNLFPPFLNLIFIICAILGISFHTLFAFEVHKVSKENESSYSFAHQYIFNFAGSFIGWVMLYYFLFIRLPNLNIIQGINWEDLLIIFIAFIGITGYLPYYALMGKKIF